MLKPAPAEVDEIRDQLNTTDQYVPAVALHKLFEMQVARTPQAVAVICEGEALTYSELDALSTRLASHLAYLGVGPDCVVAVMLDRSFELIAALLAVLKTGAAYLPIDVSYPADRIAFMISDARPVCVLTTSATASVVATDAKQVHVDEVTSTKSDELPMGHRDVQSDDAAYVIYTSGSTGRPKGVVVSHGAIVNRLCWMQAEYGLGTDDRVLQKTPAGFDVSVWEFFWPLIAGAALVMAKPDGHREPEYLADLIASEQITTVHFVPSMLQAFLSDDVVSRCISLRRVICSGEALPVELRRRFHQALDVGLHNLYGPTEAAVDATYWYCVPEPDATAVPIGRPVWNTRAEVLDADMRPLPAGEVGELYLAGVQLARGYLGRPGLTAERFVADPHGAPGSRMYRTGDLARLRSDGAIEFFGRVDGQVKIRGQRIELGEIEAVLARHASVVQAAASVSIAPSGDKRLIAHVIAEPGHVITPELLRSHIRDVLPEAMVPIAFVVVTEFPLTANGKLDRAALPLQTFASVGTSRVPVNERERILVAMVAEVLATPTVSPDDSFVGLGGDSISAMRLVSRAWRAGLRLTTDDVLRQRDLAALANAARTDLEPISVKPADGIGTFTPTPIMHWLRERSGPVDSFSQSMVVRTPAGARKVELEECLQAVLDTHDILRSRLDTGTGEWRLETLPAEFLSAANCLEVIEAHHVADDVLPGLVQAGLDQARAHLSMSAPMMLHALWFDRGPLLQGRLALVINHLAVDGVSWRILRSDLAGAWETLVDEGEPRVEPAPTSFRRWSLLLTGEAASDRRQAEFEYWLRAASGRHAPLGSRALDRRVDLRSTSGSLTLDFPSELTEPLLTRTPSVFNTDVNTVLLTGLALAVAVWRRPSARSIDGDLLVALEGHGREDVFGGVDLSRTVGWFTTVFPVCLGLRDIGIAGLRSADMSVGNAVKQIKEQLNSLPDKGIGYGLLRHLNPSTSNRLAAGSDAVIGFNYLGRFVEVGCADWALDAEFDVGMDESDDDMPLAHLIEVNAVSRDRGAGPVFSATWTWARGAIDDELVRDLADLWFQMLARITDHAGKSGAGGLTPSDLSLLTLNQAEIDEIESEMHSPRGRLEKTKCDHRS